MSNLRIGIGYDVHRLESNLDLILAGVQIDHYKGIVAHSDGDIILHTISDALLGATSLGDIGCLFPDTKSENKNISSSVILLSVLEKLRTLSYSVVNIDVSIALQKPKIQPYVLAMRKSIAQLMQIDLDLISIKATTTEKMGFEGHEQGVSCYSVVLIQKN